MGIVVVARADGAGYVRSIGCASWLYSILIYSPAGLKAGQPALNRAGPAYNPARGLESGFNIYIHRDNEWSTI